MRILHLEPQRYPKEAKDLLEAQGPIDFADCHDPERLLKLVAEQPYTAVFVKLGLSFDAAFMDACPTLTHLVTPTTGLNHIDLKEAEQRGITVLSLKGETELLDTIKSTAEHTWALLLMLMRHLQEATADAEAG